MKNPKRVYEIIAQAYELGELTKAHKKELKTFGNEFGVLPDGTEINIIEAKVLVVHCGKLATKYIEENNKLLNQ